MITPRYISELLGAPMAAIVNKQRIAARATADLSKKGNLHVSQYIDGTELS